MEPGQSLFLEWEKRPYHWNRQTPEQKDWWRKMESRDPSQFTGHMQPYILFSNAVRDDIKQNWKGDGPCPIPEIGRQSGEAWRDSRTETRCFGQNKPNEFGIR